MYVSQKQQSFALQAHTHLQDELGTDLVEMDWFIPAPASALGSLVMLWQSPPFDYRCVFPPGAPSNSILKDIPKHLQVMLIAAKQGIASTLERTCNQLKSLMQTRSQLILGHAGTCSYFAGHDHAAMGLLLSVQMRSLPSSSMKDCHCTATEDDHLSGKQHTASVSDRAQVCPKDVVQTKLYLGLCPHPQLLCVA